MRDQKENMSAISSFRVWFHKMLSAPVFDHMIAVVILVNVTVLAIEIDIDTKSRYKSMSAYQTMMNAFSYLEWFFVFVYTGELALRIFVYKFDAFRSPWVQFDAVLVLTSWLEILARFVAFFAPISSASGILRICRLARLLRPFRLVGQVRALYALLHGMMQSMMTVLSAFAMIALILLIFACFALELIGKESLREVDAAFDAHVEIYFYSLFGAVLSLSRFVTLDSCYVIYHDLVSKNPYLGIYFTSLVFVRVAVSSTQGLPGGLGQACAGRPNFGGFVLGCVEATFCK